MKSPAAALGTLVILAACAHGTTTTTTTAPNRSAAAAPAAAGTANAANAAHDRVPPGVRGDEVSATGPPTRPAIGSPASGSAARAHAAHGRVARTFATPAPAPVMPQILGASLSPTVVGSGSTVSATVRTTPGVVSVVAYAGGTSMAVPRVGPGLFEGSTTLPPLPPFAHGSYAVTFVARDARGVSTQSAVGVTVR